jgi:lysyl-tRNA synthetase class 2
VVGSLSVLSAITPDVPWRLHLLLSVEPGPLIGFQHVLATLGGIALIYVGWGIVRGRRRAVDVATGVLLLLAFLNAAKGLDYEEAAVALAMAGVLHGIRRSCTRGGSPGRALLAGSVAIAAVAAAYTLEIGTLLLSDRAHTLGAAVTGAARALEHGAWWLHSGTPVAITLDVLILIAIAACGVSLHRLLRPAVATSGHSAPDHRRAAEIVERHGRDSLDPFALREEKTFFFARGGLVAYRTLRGTAVVAGDPIGPPGTGAAIVSDFLRFAAERGWEVVLTAASGRMLDEYRTLGLRSVCIGQEAVVDPSRFTLEGRAIRKVRQSVTRAERLGWTLEVVAGLREGDVLAQELAAVEARWRSTRPRLYGFAMSLGRLWGAPEDATAVYALGRAPDGELRTFVRFARCGDILSLDVMRRSGDEPNGLNEALIARTLEWARDHEISEVSLNFAGFGHIFSPRIPAMSRRQRLMRRGLGLVHSRFQLERLMVFNDKFDPTWRPRFLVYGARTHLPLAALRVLQAEAYIRPPRSRARPRRWQPLPDLPEPALVLRRRGGSR